LISTQAARLQEEEDSQFDLIQKLEREEGKHRELAEQARKEASRVDGEKGSAEAEKRRGEAEVSDLRDALADAKGDLDDTSDAYARLSQALSSSEPLDRDVATLVQTTLEEKGEELAKEEAETEKQADEALRREESVVAERRTAVEGAADEVAALAPKVLISASRGAAAPSRHRCDSPPSDEALGGLVCDFERISGEIVTRYISHRWPRPSARNARPTTSCANSETPRTRR